MGGEMTRLDERRLETRLGIGVRVLVETESAAPGESGPGELRYGQARDISANGLQLVLDRPLVVGSILAIWVEASEEQRFQLTGEVRWVRQFEGTERYLVGFQLLESDDTSILEWKEFLAGLL